MKLVYGERELVIEFCENKAEVLIIENQNYLTEFLGCLYLPENTSEKNLILSDGEKSLSLEKHAEIIWNPFFVDLNNKKILGKLYHELKEISLEEQYEEIGKMNQVIVKYLDHLSMKTPYPICFDTELEVIDLYKIYGIQFENRGLSLLEKVTEYLKIMASLGGVHLVIFLNLKDYFAENQIKELYKIAFYYKINLLLVEAHQNPKLESERCHLLDKDLCLIHYE